MTTVPDRPGYLTFPTPGVYDEANRSVEALIRTLAAAVISIPAEAGSRRSRVSAPRRA